MLLVLIVGGQDVVNFTIGITVITIRNYTKLLEILLNNGFRKEDCTIEKLRELWTSDLRLNRYKLEIAAQEQAAVFERYSSLLADISGLVEDENKKLRETRGLVDLKIRSCSKRILKVKYGVSDLKESAIKSAIELDSKVKEQEKKVRMISVFCNKLKGVVESGRQRKGLIRVLTDLYINDYYNCYPVKGKHADKRRKGY